MSWFGVRAGVWLAGGTGVRLGVGVSLGPCCGGLGVPLGLVGRVGLRGIALPGDLCLGPSNAFPWGAWPRDAAVTRTSKQAGKALRSQGHQYACVM